MADESNLFDMFEIAMNMLRKSVLVGKILEPTNKDVVSEEIKSLCTHINELIVTVNQSTFTNK